MAHLCLSDDESVEIIESKQAMIRRIRFGDQCILCKDWHFETAEQKVEEREDVVKCSRCPHLFHINCLGQQSIPNIRRRQRADIKCNVLTNGQIKCDYNADSIRIYANNQISRHSPQIQQILKHNDCPQELLKWEGTNVEIDHWFNAFTKDGIEYKNGNFVEMDLGNERTGIAQIIFSFCYWSEYYVLIEWYWTIEEDSELIAKYGLSAPFIFKSETFEDGADSPNWHIRVRLVSDVKSKVNVVAPPSFSEWN